MSNEIKLGLGTIIAAAGLFFTIAIYSMDWQRKQDQKISDLDKLIDRQKTILEMQVQYNERIEDERRRGIHTPTTRLIEILDDKDDTE